MVAARIPKMLCTYAKEPPNERAMKRMGQSGAVLYRKFWCQHPFFSEASARSQHIGYPQDEGQ